MKKFILAMAAVSAGSLVLISGLKAQEIKEGKWSMTMVTQMEGMGQESEDAMKEMENMSPEEKAMMQKMMGGMNIHMNSGAPGITTTVTQCVSNDNPVPEMNSKEHCKETHSMAGNTVKFQVVCDESDSSGQVTYKDDSMEGMVKSTQMVDGKATNATIKISGKYLGPC